MAYPRSWSSKYQLKLLQWDLSSTLWPGRPPNYPPSISPTGPDLASSAALQSSLWICFLWHTQSFVKFSISWLRLRRAYITDVYFWLTMQHSHGQGSPGAGLAHALCQTPRLSRGHPFPILHGLFVWPVWPCHIHFCDPHITPRTEVKPY